MLPLEVVSIPQDACLSLGEFLPWAAKSVDEGSKTGMLGVRKSRLLPVGRQQVEVQRPMASKAKQTALMTWVLKQ